MSAGASRGYASGVLAAGGLLWTLLVFLIVVALIVFIVRRF